MSKSARVLLSFLLILTVLVPFVMQQSPSRAQTVQTIAVVEDTYIDTQNPTVNYGSSTRLRVDSENTVDGLQPTMQVFVKYAQPCPVTTCDVWFYSDNSYNDFLLVWSTDVDWSESTMTADNPCSCTFTIIDSVTTPAAGWWSLSVPQGVQAINIVGQSTTQYPMHSREASAATAPYMSYTEPAPTETPTNTAVPPTNTPTNTAVPPTNTPTNTAVPPTNTPTNTAVPPTSTPTATATPITNVTLPARAAFYYPWFPEGWNQQGYNPFTQYQPSLGYYSSADATVVADQVDAMVYGGIDVAVSSWWGIGDATDQRVETLLDAAVGTSLKVALYHEMEGSSNPTVSALTADLTYIRDTYATSSAYAKIDGKFVVFVYNADDFDCSVVDRWTQAADAVGAYVVLKVFSGYTACTTQPDSWHQYAPANATDHQSGYSYGISPGFWRIDEQAPRLARDLTRWATNIQSMIASGEDWQLIVSFNEWGEGTSVESASEWASTSGYGDYLDLLHTDGVGLPTPTPTPTEIPYTSVTASGDSWVQDDLVTSNFGTNIQLRVDNLAPLTYSFIEFPSACPIACTLHIYSANSSTGTISVYDTGDFDEATITWNTKPAQGALLDSAVAPTAGWVTFDLPAGTQRVMLASTSSTRWPISSREGTNPPFVDYGVGGQPTATPTSTPVPTNTPTNTPTPTATTVPSGSAQAVLYVTGDMVYDGTSGSRYGRHAEVVQAMKTAIPNEPVEPYYLWVGDIAYDSGCYAQFVAPGKYADTYGTLPNHNARVLPVVGNHETVCSGGLAANYEAYFGTSVADPLGNGTFHYEKDLGDWRLIVVNQYNNSSQELAWLESRLQAAPEACVMVATHESPYSSGDHHGFYSGESNTTEKAIFELAYDYGVELFLAGHDHHYERSYPITGPNDGFAVDTQYGVVQVISGIGGKENYWLNGQTSTQPYPTVVPNAAAVYSGRWNYDYTHLSDSTKSDMLYGWTRLTLYGDHAVLTLGRETPTNTTGVYPSEFDDSATITCHGAHP